MVKINHQVKHAIEDLIRDKGFQITFSYLSVCSPSEDNLWLGLWLNVKKDEQKPDIMHETDDKYTRVLKEFILEMLSYTPDVRPKITQVFQHIGHQIMQVKQEKSITKGESNYSQSTQQSN